MKEIPLDINNPVITSELQSYYASHYIKFFCETRLRGFVIKELDEFVNKYDDEVLDRWEKKFWEAIKDAPDDLVEKWGDIIPSMWLAAQMDELMCGRRKERAQR